jgi:ectoine hydroxylase-related dioxygenase (phytanoyl-CoA dioxygenase family)
VGTEMKDEGLLILTKPRVANDLLYDRAKLDAQYEEDGFLYFSQILDLQPVLTAKRKMFSVLRKHGLIKANEDDAIWTGRPTDGIGTYLSADFYDELNELRLWQEFVAAPAIAAFFEQVLGESPIYIPIGEYRARPPGEVSILWHQDGYFNDGMSMRGAWIPLVDTDIMMGGLGLAVGMHKQGYFHDPSLPGRGIPDGAIPSETWRRPDYKPGDVVIFHEATPHTGLPNTSPQRFRVSFELRVQRVSDPRPAIGRLTAVDSDSITVACNDGEIATLALGEETLVRTRGTDASTSVVSSAAALRVGQPVVVSRNDYRAIVVRPPTS